MRISALSKVMNDLNHDLGVLTNDIDRSQILRNVKDEIKSLINLQYDPRVEFDLPKGRPPYTATWSDENQNVLYNLISRKYFKYFIKGSDLFLKDNEKRQKLFIDCLKNMHTEDASMILDIKDKKNIWPNITYDLLVMAFPNVVAGWNKKCRIPEAMEVKSEEQSLELPDEVLTISTEGDILGLVNETVGDEEVNSKKKGKQKVK